MGRWSPHSWKPQSWSLRLKLTLGYALVFALTILLGAVGVYFTARSSLTASLDQTLRETAAVAQASVETQKGRSFFAPQLKASSDLSIELLSASGRLLTSVGRDEDTSPPFTLGFVSFAEQRVFTQDVGSGLYLRISRPSDTLSHLLETLARILLVGSVLMIGVACAAGYSLADRALRPVDAVARTAAAIAGRGNYRERVPAMSGHDEMARLTNTVNAMLDQLEHTIEREKQFARIAAHELRTPLTVLKGRLELTLERPRDAAAYQKALAGMQGRVDALMTLSESLLALARSDAPVQLEPVELAAGVIAAAEQLSDAAQRTGKRVHLSLTESWIEAEPDGLQRVLMNLMENALKYGTGEVVDVRVEQQSCIIRSGGAGPKQDDWPRLLQPFERGSGVQSTPGSGLGLALVSALTQRWNARVQPQWSSGNFSVQVQFTAAQQTPSQNKTPHGFAPR
ncbi:sensor histidine kinase (plasmid) [Deinococcus psychrotolerans]|uniref:histidine kinase n=1 Tax=Deinococcus psychrotolerans TaxID=2489213 RepID=A0A3G8YUG5_9DEIO|nr:HAMP domain-containing sensor histidine kinase [Deinococcus psychrotolerans]AZI44866.1 sensor histidine kinase [Deinococcus psychrotolerans]